MVSTHLALGIAALLFGLLGPKVVQTVLGWKNTTRLAFRYLALAAVPGSFADIADGDPWGVLPRWPIPDTVVDPVHSAALGVIVCAGYTGLRALDAGTGDETATDSSTE